MGDQAAGFVRAIAGRDLVPGRGIAALNTDSRYVIPCDSDVHLQDGDLIVRKMIGNVKGMVVEQYAGGNEHLVAHSSVIILRPKPDTDPLKVLGAALFLRSEVAGRLVTANQARALVVDRRVLADLAIPVPEREVLEALEHLSEARDAMDTWAQEASSMLAALYLRRDAQSASRDVMDASRTLRQRVERAKALDDPAERFRTTYAYPVAARWRAVEAASTGPDKDRALKCVLDASEILLAYAAFIGLIFAREQEISLPCLAEIRHKLSTGRSGLGFGDYVNILQEVSTNKAVKAVAANAPLSEVQAFFRAEGVLEARSRLSTLRIDNSHLRSLTGRDLEDAYQRSFDDLVTLLEASAPLSDIKLTYITNTRNDTLRNEMVVRVREFMGDHSVVPDQQMTVDSGLLLEAESLYLRDAQQGWHLARPLLLANACPAECPNSRAWITDILRNVPTVWRHYASSGCSNRALEGG